MAAAQSLSPAELAYLHNTLSLNPPIRTDGRTPTQFRPLTAETGILPGTNGSARVCFADGTEAIVGIKAEIEKTVDPLRDDDADEESRKARAGRVRGDWVEIAVEIPGVRDDDAATIYLGEMLREAMLGDGEFAKKLWINSRFHWRLYIDILLISPPLSYPLPLLSLTTHLALLATRLPRLKSEGDEDPMFDDDWESSRFLYPRQGDPSEQRGGSSRPPITLLVIAVGNNIIFDPTREELTVAESALAVSVSEVWKGKGSGSKAVEGAARQLRLLSIRMIDPPSRLTPPGVPHDGAAADGAPAAKPQAKEGETPEGVWKAPLGGTKFAVLDGIIQTVLEQGGVAHEVLDGLEGVELA
ncbi:hypothetical protein N3K66_008557 [Trichothecium roseum]|uniref:Uncharacterized protein n=1 Tax=Trichothecium roseum TaxID=47278 RepID=A0ACC0URM5_9HYPO|nr:hypothetical protein N3K66_008557 [Trichothecium roseum]